MSPQATGDSPCRPDWREAQLGDLLDITHGFAFKGEYFTVGGPVRIVTPGNFYEKGGFRDRGAQQKSYDGPIPHGYVLSPGDVVVAMTEQAAGLLGSSGYVPSHGTWLHNQRIGRVVLRDGRASKRFVYHLLNEPSVRAQISATATGAKVRHTAPERIRAVRIRCPNRTTQARIGAFLDAFDDAMTINERRIALLEGVARSLHREWFVRFRFPGAASTHVEASQDRRPPPDWHLRRVGEIAEVVTEGVEPRDVDHAEPYVGLQHIPRRSTTLRDWASIDGVSSRKLRFRAGDTLFGKIRPYFHKVAWAPFDGVASSDTIIMRARGDQILPALVASVMSSDELVAEAVATSNGTKMPRANPDALLRYEIALPPLDGNLIRSFEHSVRSFLDMAGTLVAQNRALDATRDLLLSRLVTGQLDIARVALSDLLSSECD